jgi:hypothetical protein
MKICFDCVCVAGLDWIKERDNFLFFIGGFDDVGKFDVFHFFHHCAFRGEVSWENV